MGLMLEFPAPALRRGRVTTLTMCRGRDRLDDDAVGFCTISPAVTGNACAVYYTMSNRMMHDVPAYRNIRRMNVTGSSVDGRVNRLLGKSRRRDQCERG